MEDSMEVEITSPRGQQQQQGPAKKKKLSKSPGPASTAGSNAGNGVAKVSPNKEQVSSVEEKSNGKIPEGVLDGLKMKVHHSKFFDWNPALIACVAFTSDGKYLAVGLSNGSIAIRSVTNDWHMERIISGDGLPLKSIIWASHRLFVGTLNGYVVEYDFNDLKLKNQQSSYGGAVWGLAVNPDETSLALACDDGCVRIFDITNGSLQYVRSGIKAEGKIMCISWHINGNDIFTGGSDGTIRRWAVSDSAISVVSTVRPQFKLENVIWAITVLKDFTVVIGDSLGNTQFWDGNMGVLLNSFQQHEADVLAVVVNESLGVVFSSGIDSKVVMFQLHKEGPISKWTYSYSQRLHTHDVRALAISNKYLVSGGNEARVGVYPIRSFREVGTFIKLSPFPQKSIISHTSSAKTRLLLLQYERRLGLWRIGRPSKTNLDGKRNGEYLKIAEESTCLLEIKVKGHPISCSALSSDGSFVACSDSASVKLFNLQYGEDNAITVQKLKLPESLPKQGANTLLFTHDGKRLIIAGKDHVIYVFDLEKMSLVATFNKHTSDKQNIQPAAICTLAVSSDDKYLASGDLNNFIHIFNLEAMQYHISLPRMPIQHSTFAFQPEESILGVVCASNYFFFFDFAKKQLINWPPKMAGNVLKEYNDVRSRIIGMKFHPQQKEWMLVYSDHNLFFVNLKTSRVKDARGYRGLLFADYLDNGDLVLVDRPWTHIIPSLPDPLYRVRYAT